MNSNLKIAEDGADITLSQDTPTAKIKENSAICFDCNVELQTTVEKLPKGIANCTSVTLIRNQKLHFFCRLCFPG